MINRNNILELLNIQFIDIVYKSINNIIFINESNLGYLNKQDVLFLHQP